MRNISILLILGALFIGAGCKTTSEPSASEEAPVNVQMEDAMIGTVTHIDLEGGFYGIMTEDGGKYFPINLDDAYKEDGLRIQFTMRERTDVMTTTMWGTTIEITAIEKL